jgi:uncharacterized phage protein gp47/JayE
MAFFDRTQQEIVSASLDRLADNTNITQLAPGSKMRFLIDTFAEEQASQHITFDENLMQAFIKYADGKFLDFFGDMLNSPRYEPTHAFTDDENFMFYVSSGTFGDINGGSDFVVPNNTNISTVPFDGQIVTPGLTEYDQINYTTTDNVTCRASESFVYAPIRAVIEGSSSDVPRGVLNQHDFSNYALSGIGTLKCTNKYSISSGRDRESNESYRFRLTQLFRSRQLAIYASIRLAALSVPGVSDVRIVNCEQGPGSFSVYVKSISAIPSPRLIDEVSTNIAAVCSYGVRPFILSPEPIGLEFVAAVLWSPRATQAQIAEGYNQMRLALEDDLNSRDIGEEVVFSDLIDVLLSASQYANSIGVNRPNKFEEVYAYRSDPSGQETAIRNLVSGDRVTPLYNERAILETSGRFRGIQFLTRQQV